MKKQIERCMGCMSEKLYKGPCKVCGYIDNNSYPADCLAPGTLLEDRYVVGKMISKNGEGVVYLAFDTAENIPAEIQEFLPDTLCKRGEDGLSVEVKEGSLPLFKSYLSEFADLHKTLISEMKNTSLKTEYDLFSAGSTGYVVSEHLKGKALEEYLEQNGGKLPWEDISVMLRPVLDTLDALHEKGIVHRGISPSTLFVTKDRRLVMTSVDISAARTADSQINSEMYEGYAACEQYDLSERQGSWTDIYAICAVLYKALTGETPPSAVLRKTEDTMKAPAELDPEIPANVSEAITSGMHVNRAVRVHNVETLTQMLYNEVGFKPESNAGSDNDEPVSDGPITPRVSVKPIPEHHRPEKKRSNVPTKEQIRRKKEKQKKMSNIGTVIGIVIFFSLVAALIIAILYFADEAQQEAAKARTAIATTVPDETEPEDTTTTARSTETTTTTTTRKKEDILLLPDFVNRFFNTSFETRYSMLKFEALYEYSDEYSEGIIYEQDIPAGTQVRSGTTIHIKVSKGAAYTYLPDYIGLRLSEFTDKLNQLGVRYDIEPEETSEVKAGYVIRCSKEIGDRVYISENEHVTVYYAVTPTVTTTTATPPPETVPPETTTQQNVTEEDEIEEVIGEEQ